MPTPFENAVMDLWELGMGKVAIAERLNASARQVDRVLGYMAEKGDQARANRMMIECSAQLRDAIHRARHAATALPA